MCEWREGEEGKEREGGDEEVVNPRDEVVVPLLDQVLDARRRLSGSMIRITTKTKTSSASSCCGVCGSRPSSIPSSSGRGDIIGIGTSRTLGHQSFRQEQRQVDRSADTSVSEDNPT